MHGSNVKSSTELKHCGAQIVSLQTALCNETHIRFGQTVGEITRRRELHYCADRTFDQC